MPFDGWQRLGSGRHCTACTEAWQDPCSQGERCSEGQLCDRPWLNDRKYSYVSHIGSLVMGHPDLTIHHMVRVYPGSRFDYRTPLSMGRPDPEQSFTNYGTAVGNNAPNEWSGWVYLDCHIPPHTLRALAYISTGYNVEK